MRAFVAARKGLLVSDPTVLSLSRSQLWLEYMAERRLEKSDREFYVKSLRYTLINLFGLNLKEQFEAHRDDRPIDDDAFVPLILVAGNHHLMKGYLEGMQGAADDQTGQSKITDAEYEEQAQRMLADMEPIEGDAFAGLSDADVINLRQAKALGIKDIDEFPMPADAVIIGPG
jgi:hypothetical protein